MKNNKTLVVISGPTAAGKTALALKLAKHYNTAVLSADSRQLFSEMSIGTARPSRQEMEMVPHYFVGSHSIMEDYNVGKFEAEALAVLEKLFAEKDLVIMAGGSGLYIDAVCEGFDELPEADEHIRERIRKLEEDGGITALQELLKKLDPLHYSKADLYNPRRLSRAIEVCLSAGKPYSSLRAGKTKERPFQIIKAGISPPRAKLYERINERVDDMMKAGLLEEAKALIQHRSCNAMQTVGYKELFDHLEGKTDLETAVSLIKQHTRNFAKRQLTWFRKDKNISWFEPGETEKVIRFIEERLRK